MGHTMQVSEHTLLADIERRLLDEFPSVAPITVMFSVGQTTIPETDFPAEQRQTADRFLTALRKGVGL